MESGRSLNVLQTTDLLRFLFGAQQVGWPLAISLRNPSRLGHVHVRIQSMRRISTSLRD